MGRKMANRPKGKRTVIFEHFKTLGNLLDIMESRELNAVFQQERSLSSQIVETDGRFTGTETYGECMELLRSGYKEPLDKMKKAVLQMGQMDNYVRPKTKNDYVGFLPHVPNALMGLPMTMINREKQANKARTINLMYSFCASASTPTRSLIKAGINFIGLVNSLEKQGFRVRIDIMFCTNSNSSSMAYTVNLKEYGQQLNLLKLSFPLIHPSMLRRISFKWLETLPNLQDNSYRFGYGYPLPNYFDQNREREENFLFVNGIITGKNVYYCNVYTAMRAKDTQELATKIGLVK